MTRYQHDTETIYGLKKFRANTNEWLSFCKRFIHHNNTKINNINDIFKFKGQDSIEMKTTVLENKRCIKLIAYHRAFDYDKPFDESMDPNLFVVTIPKHDPLNTGLPIVTNDIQHWKQQFELFRQRHVNIYGTAFDLELRAMACYKNQCHMIFASAEHHWLSTNHPLQFHVVYNACDNNPNINPFKILNVINAQEHIPNSKKTSAPNIESINNILMCCNGTILLNILSVTFINMYEIMHFKLQNHDDDSNKKVYGTQMIFIKKYCDTLNKWILLFKLDTTWNKFLGPGLIKHVYCVINNQFKNKLLLVCYGGHIYSIDHNNLYGSQSKEPKKILICDDIDNATLASFTNSSQEYKAFNRCNTKGDELFMHGYIKHIMITFKIPHYKFPPEYLITLYMKFCGSINEDIYVFREPTEVEINMNLNECFIWKIP